MKEVIYIVGHKHPDMDSIASAIALANFKKLKGHKHFIPARAGRIDEETKFVLERFETPSPEELKSAKGKRIVLVDHGEKKQMVSGGDDAEVIEIIDHHKIGNICTSKPIRYHAEPVGSSSTIVANYYFDHGLEMPENIAGILLSAIISDTDMFKSPVTTELDKKTAKKLAEIADVDIEEHAEAMFKAKTKIDEKTIKELIRGDFKEYSLPGDIKLAVNQIKLMGVEKFLKEKKNELIKEMKKTAEKEGYDIFINMVTDLIKEGSELIVVGPEKKLFEEAFNVELENNSIYIKGIMSRKTQVIPNFAK